MKAPRTHSILSIAADCPKIDVAIIEDLFSSRATATTTVSRLAREGYLKVVKQHSPYNPTSHYALTALGMARLINFNLQFNFDKSSLYDDSNNGIFRQDPHFPSNYGSFSKAGNSHFKSMEITRFWMQLRWTGMRKHALLWDYVDDIRSKGISGIPDIVLYDDYNPETLDFKKLVFFELESTTKSEKQVKDKINALIRNDFYFIVFASKEISVLRNISHMMRRFMHTSIFYAMKGIFEPFFLDKKCGIQRIWFMHWDANIHGFKDSGILETKLMRADHPQFDMYAIEPIADGTKYKKIHKFDRWDDGVNEWNLNSLLKFVSRADRGEA